MGRSYYFLKRTPLEPWSFSKEKHQARSGNNEPLRKQNKYVVLTDKEIRKYFEEFYNYKSELDKHIENNQYKKNI